jgi:signal transduction histidine kinase
LNETTVREYLGLISSENERLSRLIQNFLAFSRMERSQYTLQFAVVPARQILDAALAAVRERFEAPGCRLDVKVDAQLPDLLGDADALATALINLLDNAYKYSEDIKHIVLSARSEGGRVIFTVKDNGIGIPPREAKRIFQPFYQVDQRLARKAGGCGLGLGIVQFITKAHRGRISVESEPGCGSTFTLSLPAAVTAARLRQEAVA